jgi:hypothetical protein
MMTMRIVALLLLFAFLAVLVRGFPFLNPDQRESPSFAARTNRGISSSISSNSRLWMTSVDKKDTKEDATSLPEKTGGKEEERATTTAAAAPEEVVVGVVAPLHYKGPYPCLSLCFPRFESCLEFVMDTGANVNSLQAYLAEEYNLPRLSYSDFNLQPPVASTGMGGELVVPSSDNTPPWVLLGDCQLGGMPTPAEASVIFMRNLTASAMPQASPMDTAGLLGSPFVLSFAGVEFDWYGTDGDPPTTIFYFQTIPPEATKSMTTRVPLKTLFGLLTLNVTISGVELPALLDTGSPITVLNEKAAKQAGINVTNHAPIGEATSKKDEDEDRENAPSTKKQKRQSIADGRLRVGGVDGRTMTLQRSQSSAVHVHVGNVSLGLGPIYVGDLPGISFLETAYKLQQQESSSSSTTAAAFLPVTTKKIRVRRI